MSLLNRVAHMDIFDLCDCIDDNKIDMILCDLPYGITACEWDSVIPMKPMWAAFKRIIKPRGAIVLTASQPFTSQLVISNLDMFKYSLVWNKSRPTGFINANNRPLSAHEDVNIFSFGTIANGSNSKMAYNPQGTVSRIKKEKRSKRGGVHGERPNQKDSYISTVGNYPTTQINIPSITNTQHPTQKPVALFEYLIRTYTQPGEVVFDPCVGSGTTAIAARNTGRNFIVGDNSAEYVDIARKRLDKPYTMPMFEEAEKQEQAQQMEMEFV